MMYRVVFIALLSLPSAVAHAQGYGLPPTDAVERALDNYPGFAAAEARVRAAQAESDMLRAGPHEFVISGGIARRTVEREGRFSESDASLSRTIRLPHKGYLDRKAGRLGVEVAENRSADAHHYAALLLAERWYDWLLAGALVRNDEDTVTSHRKALEAMQRRLDERDAALLDVDQTQSALATAEAQLADSRAKLERARVTLAATFPDIALDAQPPTLPAPVLPTTDIKVLSELVISRSHEIVAAEREAQRRATVAGRVRADRIPDPTVGMRVFRERGGLENGVGVSLSIPLGWEHRRASAAKASAEAAAAEFDLADVRRQIKANADADLADVQTRLAAWSSANAAMQSADAAAARTERGYQMGALDLSDLLYTQRQAFEARRSEISAKAAALNAIVKLLIDSHTIWSDTHDEQ